VLVRRNKVALEKVRTFGSDLHAVLLGEAVSAHTQTDQDENSADIVKLNPNPPVKIVGAAFAN
jgi:hypothetical protein